MAAIGTLTQSGAVLLKAGKGVSDDFKGASAEANIGKFTLQAEAFINITSRYDWVGQFASLDAQDKMILEEAASNLAGMYCISYDMSGYSSRLEAGTMLDVLRDRFTQLIEILKDRVKIQHLGGN